MRPRPQWGQGWRKGGDHRLKKAFYKAENKKKIFNIRVARIRASPRYGGARRFPVFFLNSVTDPPRGAYRCISEESLMALFSCSFVTEQGLTGEESIRIL